MSFDTRAERAWLQLLIDGEKSYDKRFKALTENEEWELEEAVISVLSNSHHLCACSRPVRNYWVFKSKKGETINCGECCVGKLSTKDEYTSLMNQEKREYEDILKLVKTNSVTAIYPSNRIKRVM